MKMRFLPCILTCVHRSEEKDNRLLLAGQEAKLPGADIPLIRTKELGHDDWDQRAPGKRPLNHLRLRHHPYQSDHGATGRQTGKAKFVSEPQFWSQVPTAPRLTSIDSQTDKEYLLLFEFTRQCHQKTKPGHIDGGSRNSASRRAHWDELPAFRT